MGAKKLQKPAPKSPRWDNLFNMQRQKGRKRKSELTDAEVNTLQDGIVRALHEKFGAVLR